MNRLDFFGGSASAWAIAVVLVSALFGASHEYQGVSGMVSNFVSALTYSALYLLSGRNLWLPIFAHGAEDTFEFLLIFLGRYPGL